MATDAILIPYESGGSRAVIDCTADQNWGDGDDFRLEAQGGEVRLHEAAAAPDLDMSHAYIRLVAGDVYFHAQGATENLYAWTPQHNGAQLVVNGAE